MSTLLLVLPRFHSESINLWMYLDYPLVPFLLPALRAQRPRTLQHAASRRDLHGLGGGSIQNGAPPGRVRQQKEIISGSNQQVRLYGSICLSLKQLI